MKLNLALLLRQLVYHLPPSWQLPVKDIRDAILRQPDSSISVMRLRMQEQGFLEETILKYSQLPDRKRILINSLQNFPPTIEVDYVLATALRLRGHDLRGILCDGLLPICERNIGPQVRPPCEVCTMWVKRYEDAFGFNFARLSDFISIKDRKQAESLIAHTPTNDLQTLVVNGIQVGRLAISEIQRYCFGYVFDPTGDALPVYRQWLVTGVLFIWLFERILNIVQPDIVVTISGRTLNSAILCQAARNRGIHVITWDTSPYHPNGLIFSHNSSAVEIRLEDVWPEVSKQNLLDYQLNELNEYMRRWSRSEITPFPYNPKPLEDEVIIRQKLGLRLHSPTIVAFTNISWDMSSVDRDIGFESMYDWIFSLVTYAIAHPELDLVIRTHPAEKNVTTRLKSNTLVATEVKKRYKPLPKNIKLVEADSPISSYVLGEMADVIILYSGFIGLEMALRGRRVWVAGDFTYRGKGFTLDLESRNDMYDLLDRKIFDNQLLEDDVKSAQKFAYLWIFRHIFRNPFIKSTGKHFSLDSFRALGPGGDPIVNDLCEAILSGKPFIDIGHANKT